MRRPAAKATERHMVQQADIVRGQDSTEVGPKHRSDVGCGFVQFCHKHIFASPAVTASGRTRKVSPSDPAMSECNSSLQAHFNPCYSNSSLPDDDDDDELGIDLNAASLFDSLHQTRRTDRPLPAVSEMSMSCFEGLLSSTSSYKEVIGFPSRQFRPLSWAGQVEDGQLMESVCTCSSQSAFSTSKSESCYPLEAQLLNNVSQIPPDELCLPWLGETPVYWELEMPRSDIGTTDLASQTSLPPPETCQKLASPLRMGTHTIFDAGNVVETNDAQAAAGKNRPPCQNSCSMADTLKAPLPRMGCLPAHCYVCRDCQHVCIGKETLCAESSRTPPLLSRKMHVPRSCKCVKPRRCPTPPRMLSPCVDDDDSVRVPVADI